MIAPLPAVLAACALLATAAIVRADEGAAPLPWRETFDGVRGGVADALQWQSGMRLSHGGEVSGWRHEGFHAVHAAERHGGGSAAILLWEDERLTLLTGIAANDAGVGYRLSCDVAPAVYATPAQATADGDGVVVEILRGDGTALASTTLLPGPWQGRLLFARRWLDWTGDGSGPVRIALRAARREGRFAGAIDELLIERAGAGGAADEFTARIAPLLAARCVSCHRGEGAEGELDLSTAAGLAAGGASGPALDADSPLDGLLWRRVAAGEMPPEGGMSAEEAAVLRDWLARGAAWSGGPLDPFLASTSTRAGADWWSLSPLAGASPPEPADPWPANDIDRFVLARLRSARLAPSPQASPRELVRRLWVDVLGLPPDPESIREFERDPSEEAWGRLVDRALAAPGHGERMARHWLDVARFGESDGYEHNAPRAHAWHYRDWLVRSFNADLPWDEFTRLQVAGDVLAPGTLDGVAATGFLVAGVHNPVVGASPAMREAARQDGLEEIAGTVAQTFLGLTVHCGRCHDHKVDPVPTDDYYAFAAALAGVRHGVREVVGPDGAAVPVYAALSGDPGEVRVLPRGDVRRSGREVVPGGLSAVRGGAAEFGLGPGAGDAERRRALADWLVGPARDPLHRVVVNRVWQWHFGAGIVDTPGDLGFNGGRPSHPELLDWLAARFREQGQSLRWLHREILTSRTWRMASAPRSEGVAVDSGNRLLWRQNRRRVEAEVFRDALLSCAGLLTGQAGGPGYRDVAVREVPPTHYYIPEDIDDPTRLRRTLYRFSPRGERSGLLDTFDCPDPSARTARRGVTTTPGQTLSQWNDGFVLRMAEAFAARVARDVGDGAGDEAAARRVDRAWDLAFGRLPDDEERRAAVDHLHRYGLAALCRVLFASSEFVVID